MNQLTPRENMLNGQIMVNRITSAPLLKAIEKLDRAKFLPANLAPFAYSDKSLVLDASNDGTGHDGKIMPSPLAQASLLQAANLKPDESVLVIGANGGYVAALASQLAGLVHAVEQGGSWAENLTQIADGLALDNLIAREGTLKDGLPEGAPYNVIIIEGAVEEIPQAIIYQLVPQGRLITAIPQAKFMSKGTVLAKVHNMVRLDNGLNCTSTGGEYEFPLLTAFKAGKKFQFSTAC